MWLCLSLAPVSQVLWTRKERDCGPSRARVARRDPHWTDQGGTKTQHEIGETECVLQLCKCLCIWARLEATLVENSWNAAS